ncbi:FtsX-like permease family protein [Litorilinea aerophila]|uniref:FtsX-like permease family protein n=1 Tax=Litorilinea aerophila TaxID=1204385 RepID=A0A540VFH9_9CHLR|nr:FtsX-like permease family protein [Litorilinea aerophila]MCC9076815.1 FtsX-like permease family protein [Litorilinea aerophila]
MTDALRAILRLARRHVLRRPLQSLFFVVGVAIGVAMIVAIDLANGSAQRAFNLGTETVTGRATHQILGGPGGLDEALYVRLRRELGVRASAPVVEEYVVVPELDGQPMRLLGVDPFAEPPFRSYLNPAEDTGGPPDFLAALMATPNTVLLSQAVAERYGLQPGDALTAQVGTRQVRLTVAGLLAPSDDLSRRALETVLIADIATAQEVLGRVGRLDRIDLLVPEGAAGEALLRRIGEALPPGAYVEPSAAREGTVGEMTAAFRLNLTALSLLALVVGMFLIYNTVAFSVVQRRPVLGTLRSLGMTRREIYLLILVEAALLGLAGTAAGLVLGVALGRGAVQLVTRTINDLFFVVSVQEVDIPTFTLVKGGVMGMVAALVGAMLPAWEATGVPPAGAFQRSQVEERARRTLPWATLAALLLLGLGAGLLWPDGNLVVAFVGLFAVILGCALLTPAFLWGLLGGLRRLVEPWAGVITRMAPRSILRSLSRTAVAVAALMVAVSVIIGVGVMIGSFRTTVELWLEDVLQADIFVSPPSLRANRVSTTLDAHVVTRLAEFPGIAGVATSRGVDVAAFLDPSPQAVVQAGVPVRVVALSRDLAGAGRRYREAVGDWQETWQAVEAGGVLVNEPLFHRLGLGVGDVITLQTDRGRRGFPIVGVTVDFDVNLVVFMADGVYRQWWDDPYFSAVALFVAPGVDVDAKVAELRGALAAEGTALLVRSNRGTRENALEIFDRTFSITVALQLLATLVAFIGILSTLMSLQLERSREIGVLRATGMTRRQLWRLSLLETGLLGASAGLLALPTGLLLAAILIYIINVRSFGWTLAMQVQPWELVRALGVALVAALLAGLYPAWRMGQARPAEALRSE